MTREGSKEAKSHRSKNTELKKRYKAEAEEARYPQEKEQKCRGQMSRTQDRELRRRRGATSHCHRPPVESPGLGPGHMYPARNPGT